MWTPSVSPRGVTPGSTPVTASFGERGPGTSISTATTRCGCKPIEIPAARGPAGAPWLASGGNGTSALTAARYWPGAVPFGTSTVNEMSRPCFGASVIVGTETTIQRAVRATGVSGVLYTAPVVLLVYASTAPMSTWT